MTNLVTNVERVADERPDHTAISDEGRGVSYREFCLSNLAEYKHPCEVEFIEELPRTTTGKVQKSKLVDEEVEAE